METYITTLDNEEQNITTTIPVISVPKMEVDAPIIEKIIAKTEQELDNEINEKIEQNIRAAEPYFNCVLNFGDLLDFGDDNVLATISSLNSHLRLETDKNNNLIILMPTYDKTGRINSKLNQQLANWNDIDELGEVYDSSTGFKMPITHSIKSPDVSFILHHRLEILEDDEQFRTIVPDFVIELRSSTDRLKTVIAKMEEYIENGVRLGWLIDPQTENVHIYRLNRNHTMQNFDETLSGEDVLPKFELNLRSIFKK
jgi:Uma2 family endonuclease